MSPRAGASTRARFRPVALAVLLVLIGSVRIVSTYQVFNHTIDEPDHLAAGMEWLSIGKYRYEDQHPPLARVFGALGPFLAGERFRAGPGSYREGYRILGRDEHYDRTLSLGRAGILPFFWIACVVVYRWAARAAGARAAVFALLLFTTLPPVLAHAGLITTDMAAAALIGAAALASLEWAEKPDRRRSLCLGTMLGLALLSKFSALVFLPAGWFLMYICHCVRVRASVRQAVYEIAARRRALFTVAVMAFLVVWAGYLFSFGKVEFLHLRLPAPRFFSGIYTVWRHNAQGHAAYLLGRRTLTGFRYYYPVVLAIKTPLGLIFLALWLPWLLRRVANRFQALLPLVFSFAIVVSAVGSHINIGVRHILPVYLGLSVSGGIALAALFGDDRPSATLARFAAVVLLAACVVSGALQHPDYLAYTNEITGRHPERFVADSDLDWGQDMKRLGDILKQRGATQLAFTPFNVTYLIAGRDLPPLAATGSEHPSPGWNAASITLWKVYGVPAWADTTPEQMRAGKSILLWYFPSGSPARP